MTHDPLAALTPEQREYVEHMMAAQAQYASKVAFKEGYAAAKAEMSAAAPGAGAAPNKPKKRRARKASTKQAKIEKWVEEQFEKIGKDTDAQPKDIVKGISDTHQTKLAYTPVQRAIETLEGDGKLLKTGEKTWRYKGPHAPNGAAA